MMDVSQHNIVTLLNIDDEDFTFDYAKSEGGPSYVMPTGKPSRFPKFLAEHALKHLIDKILTKREMKTNNEVERAKLAAQIIIEEESFAAGQVQPTEAERTKQEVERLNRPSELEEVLTRFRAKKQTEGRAAISTSQTMDEGVLPEDKEE